MELSGLQCHGCGSTNVVFDPKRRILTCNQCGKSEYYNRATLNANGKVIFSKDNAINFFMQGKYENARHYAMDVMNIFKDNAPALFILAYYDGIVMRIDGAIKRFFNEVKELPLEYDEVKELRKLFTATAYNLMDYEEDVIRLIALNMQDDEDAKELCEFVDKICPYFISKRTSMDFFTDDLQDMYSDLADHCDIPRTCFALVKSIENNPDSPYVSKCFYLKSKTQYFYNHFVLPVGEVIGSMKTEELKKKFMASYEQKRLKYESDANQ